MKASTKKNGIARISGGAGGIASGITALGGLLAAPATGGASLALTATSLGLGVASGATTFAASVANHKDMKDGAEAVKDGGKGLHMKWWKLTDVFKHFLFCWTSFLTKG